MYLTEKGRAAILVDILLEPIASIYDTLKDPALSDLMAIDTADWHAKARCSHAEIVTENAFTAWLNDAEAGANFGASNRLHSIKVYGLGTNDEDSQMQRQRSRQSHSI